MKDRGEVAAAADGMSGDRKAEAGLSAGRSGSVGSVKEWTERLNCGNLGMVVCKLRKTRRRQESFPESFLGCDDG